MFNISKWTNNNKVITISFSLDSEEYFRVTNISLTILRNSKLVNVFDLPLNRS